MSAETPEPAWRDMALARAITALTEIRAVLVDQEGHWIELQTSAAAVKEIRIILSRHGLGGVE